MISGSGLSRPGYFDTHCHLDARCFDDDRRAVLARARAMGVEELMIPSTSPASWERVLALQGVCAGVKIRAALGIHPRFLGKIEPQKDSKYLAQLEALLSRLSQQGQAMSIGECGLDASFSKTVSWERQIKVLEFQLDLARTLQLPLILHCVKAHSSLATLLSKNRLTAGGVLHSYSGSPQQIPTYLQQGLYFSFAGPITYENARKPLISAQAVPLERLLIESDAPDQTPRPFFGRAEPAYLFAIARRLAILRGMDEQELGQITSDNARLLFGTAYGPSLPSEQD